MTLKKTLLYCLIINVLIYVGIVVLLPSISGNAVWYYRTNGYTYEFPLDYMLPFAAQFGFLFGTEFLVQMFDTALFRGQNPFMTATFPVTLIIWALVLSPLGIYFYKKYRK